MINLNEVVVGDELPPLTLDPISRATLALFAGASHDHNPLHIDVDAARAAGLDDVLAHGMLSMAYAGRALTSWFAQERLMSWSARFAVVVPVHARLTCRGRVVAVCDTTVEVEISTLLADGTIALHGSAIVNAEERPSDPRR